MKLTRYFDTKESDCTRCRLDLNPDELSSIFAALATLAIPDTLTLIENLEQEVVILDDNNIVNLVEDE